MKQRVWMLFPALMVVLRLFAGCSPFEKVYAEEEPGVNNWTCMRQNGGPFEPCNRMRAVQYREGTLIPDFLDTKTSNKVWRGVVVGGLKNIQHTDADARILTTAKAIFKKFPKKPMPQVLP